MSIDIFCSMLTYSMQVRPYESLLISLVSRDAVVSACEVFKKKEHVGTHDKC
jgi:hypothetical protein